MTGLKGKGQTLLTRSPPPLTYVRQQLLTAAFINLKVSLFFLNLIWCLFHFFVYSWSNFLDKDFQFDVCFIQLLSLCPLSARFFLAPIPHLINIYISYRLTVVDKVFWQFLFQSSNSLIMSLMLYLKNWYNAAIMKEKIRWSFECYSIKLKVDHSYQLFIWSA